MPSPYDIVVKAVEPQWVASMRQIVPQMEQMGYLFTGVWTLLVSVALFNSTNVRLRAVFGVVGIVAALGIMVGLLEGVGFEAAGAHFG